MANTDTKHRNTYQRKKILDTMHQMHGEHPSADDIYLRLSQQNLCISRATVYRNLAFLSQQGFIQKINIPNSAERYEINPDPHYHAKCQNCNKVYDIHVDKMIDIKIPQCQNSEINILEYDIIFRGICNNCSKLQL